jgi:S1-C subfamily serine protease
MDYYYSKGKNSAWKYIIVGLVGALIGGLIAAYIAPVYLYGNIIPWPELPPSLQDDTGNSRNSRIDLPQNQGDSIIPVIAREITPAVVGISTVEIQYDLFFRPVESMSVGSGVIVDPNGYILTNDHVVGRARKITVILSDGRHYDAERLWSDPTLDLAVIKIKAEDLKVAPLGDSDRLAVGELAVAIGNPLGLRFQRTVTAGIISALERSLPVGNVIMQDLIQTDASINPGNSGGPLINSRGEVIGINTVKASEAEAMGFAIPINLAKPIVKSIIEHGRFIKPWLGISGIDREIAAYYNTKVKIDRGILVGGVEPGSPAYKGGIREGDIITHIQGQEINTMAKLRMVLYNLEVGQTVEIRVLRDNKERIISVTLEEMPGS